MAVLTSQLEANKPLELEIHPLLDDPSSKGRDITAKFGEIWAVGEYRVYDSEKLLPLLDVGDEVWLKTVTQGYSHVLLYIGNAEVVHVSDLDKSGIRIGKTLIRRDYLSDVATGKLAGYRKTQNLTDVMKKEIVQRALSDVGSFFPYILTTENCEHQVKSWISGKKEYTLFASTQVKDHVVIALSFGAVGAAIGVGLAIAFWSWSGYPILIGAGAGGLGLAILGTGTKYAITSMENRGWCGTGEQLTSDYNLAN